MFITGVSFADDQADAKQHFKAGKALMKVDDFKSAAVEFEASIELYRTKNALFNLAQCLRALHRYGEALFTLENLSVEFGGQLSPQMTASVEAYQKEMRSLVASLEIVVKPSGATVRVDDRVIGENPLDTALIVSPGEHAIEVSLDGFRSEKRQIHILSREKKTEKFELSSTSPRTEPELERPVADQKETTTEPALTRPRTDSQEDESKGRLSPLAWIGLGGTVAAATLTGVFFGLAKSNHDDFESYDDQIGKMQSDDEGLSALEKERKNAADDTRRYRNLGIGFGVTAGVLAVGTVIVIILDLSDNEAEESDVSAGPGGIVVSF